MPTPVWRHPLKKQAHAPRKTDYFARPHQFGTAGSLQAHQKNACPYFAAQLKGMQEVITLLVFAGFSTLYLGQALKWNHWAGFGLILVAAWLIFLE